MFFNLKSHSTILWYFFIMIIIIQKRSKLQIWKVRMTYILKTPCGKVKYKFYQKNQMSLQEKKQYKLWAYTLIYRRQGCWKYSLPTTFDSMLDHINNNMFVGMKLFPNQLTYMHIREIVGTDVLGFVIFPLILNNSFVSSCLIFFVSFLTFLLLFIFVYSLNYSTLFLPE